MDTRTARFEILCRGRNITTALAPYLLSVTWEDNAQSDKADSLEIRLEDREGLWRGPWALSKGDTLDATLITEHWQVQGQRTALSCGSFAVDELEYEHGPGGTMLSIKGIASLVTTQMRREQHTRAWEATTLKRILATIAEEQGFKHRFSGEDAHLAREDQREESDVVFLRRLAGAHGKTFKVAGGTLLMLDESVQDAKPGVGTIARESGMVTRLNLKDSCADIYRGCTISYHDPATDTLQEYTYAPPDLPASAQILKLSRRVEGREAAEKRAKAELRRRNKLEVSGDITLMGNPRFIGGAVFSLSGYGWLDGTYAIEQSRHTVDDNGYSTALSVRKTVNW